MKLHTMLLLLLPLGALLEACGGDGSSSVSLTVPGAPTIGVATAGDGSASIAFSAPTADGGTAITGYTVTCTATAGALSAVGTSSPITVAGLTNSTAYSCSVTAKNAVGSGAASASVSVTPVAATQAGTSGVECSYYYSQFNSNALVNMTSTSKWTCSGSSRSLTANGVPDHDVGPFTGPITPAIQAQSVSFSVTTLPTTGSVSNIGQQAGGYALNGISFDPSTNGFCPDTATSADLSTGGCNQDGRVGTWQMEAIGQSLFDFGADTSNGHVRPGTGSYHYHGMPNGLLGRLGKGVAMTLVGWARDGYPIYARYGHAAAMDSSSAIKVMVPSWSLKAAPDSGRPAVAVFPMGTFTQDFQYVAGSGDLDECNGRTGVTPEFPDGIYHYVVTDTFPYIGRCTRGSLAQ